MACGVAWQVCLQLLPALIQTQPSLLLTANCWTQSGPIDKQRVPSHPSQDKQHIGQLHPERPPLALLLPQLLPALLPPILLLHQAVPLTPVTAMSMWSSGVLRSSFIGASTRNRQVLVLMPKMCHSCTQTHGMTWRRLFGMDTSWNAIHSVSSSLREW